MTDNKETIIELKSKAELAIKQFKLYAKELSNLGFSLHVQADDSVYVFRDVREAYGELLASPAQRPQLATNNGVVVQPKETQNAVN